MVEYEYTYCLSVVDKLKAVVKGKFDAWIEHGNLTIRIRRFGEPDFYYNEYDIYTKMLNGYSTDHVVSSCITAFKKRIHAFYFYE